MPELMNQTLAAEMSDAFPSRVEVEIDGHRITTAGLAVVVLSTISWDDADELNGLVGHLVIALATAHRAVPDLFDEDMPTIVRHLRPDQRERVEQAVRLLVHEGYRWLDGEELWDRVQAMAAIERHAGVRVTELLGVEA